jgi:hypothetical protein
MNDYLVSLRSDEEQSLREALTSAGFTPGEKVEIRLVEEETD